MANDKKFFNMALVAIAVALLIALGFLVKIRPAVTDVAVLKTIGMTCASCAVNIEKALDSASGVGGVEIDVDRGWVLIGYNAEAANPDSFAGTVTNVGFRSWLMETMSAEEFRDIAGRAFGAKMKRSGCGNGGCG